MYIRIHSVFAFEFSTLDVTCTTSTLKSTPGNSPVLLQVLASITAPSTEYSCVSFRRRPSTAGNQAYIGLLMERNIFEGQLAESRDNYQKLLDQIPSLRTGEDSSGLATSSLPSNASTLKLHDTADFPQVKW
ncbi:hypothetical protein R3P38DRAFT_3228383 [Favolaschia claudopus]|uniref:Uncharacterized protein n=1 Tax=Favolaschia claudopus TaxID=2862362 RepID=A0AAV9ZQC8_9AGAR